MSKVSVVVPIYNAEKYLDKCIDSILNQTFKDIELILVNDGSTDNSLKICKKYKDLDSRVILVNKNNEGSVLTREKGVELSSSEYITFVDADDWILKNMVEILYNETVGNNVDITVCNTYRVLGKGLFFKKKNNSQYFEHDKIFNEEEIKDNLVAAFFHGHPFPPGVYAKLYKKELLINSGKYSKKVHFLGDDLFLNLEVFLKAKSVKIINKALYYYRYGGLTSKYMPYLFDDMVNGYKIFKVVIDEYYVDTLQKRYNGISIMLLNMFKTCLYNLFNGKLSENEIRFNIQNYVSNSTVNECLKNPGANKYFSEEYISSIRNSDIDFLFQIGKQMYQDKKSKKIIMNLLSLFPFI